ncbi:MAG: tetratricopeptide repeat protein [Actinobacteria bacterium]|nr:MAG: tetratricopeptide repeat protein [Actinomycetota bacterium]
MSTTMEHVIEVTDETFERTVIEGSSERPVVVDLWAEWCGPCRTLGPMLEKVAGERGGAFLLAKLDVDANGVGQSLLQAVRSQGIPTVVAFRNGQPVSMFIGAYPEEEVNRFIDSILPTEAELEAKEAEQAAESGDVAGAERGFRDAIAEDPDNEDAALGLAKLLIDRGGFDEARTLVAKHLPTPEAERLRAAIEVHDWAEARGDGTLAAAKRLAAAGDWPAALPGMMAALAEDRDGARQALITAFAVLGDEHELVPEYRRRLASALF